VALEAFFTNPEAVLAEASGEVAEASMPLGWLASLLASVWWRPSKATAQLERSVKSNFSSTSK
jgi:hypothetical protein